MRAVKAILIRNLINFSRDKMKLFFTILMSILFLFIFSFVMKSAAIGVEKPLDYLITGIIIMTVFQSALSNSMNTLEDISSGFMKEILVSPVSRWQISIGQILSSSIIAVFQGLIIIVIALIMGLRIDLFHLIEMSAFMIIVGITFSSIGLYVATLAKSSTTFQLMINVFVMPLTFLSGAYIPITVMPGFLKPIVYLNPLSYITAIFRYISLQMETSSSLELIKAGVAFSIKGFTILPYMGLFIILAICLIFFGLCVYQFNKADFSRVQVFTHRH
ncbi:ABC transporter permease [Halocella sp. SP3-1]|uniref:ABC transporter permease n=1 Tax=Halocella sp. SP3-1 TaxID=2382161 RepID=UPI000F760E77|nr:ABC transporter permease [Halocella sp. SP3-1]AZO93727.1 transporter [Halocella sp. SP3-1]